MPTTEQIDVLFTYRVLDQDLFEQYLAAVLPVTEKEEPYILEYTLARGADGTILQHERYENEEAIRHHLALTADGQKMWGESTELTDIRFVGPLSEKFRTENALEPIASWWDRYQSVNR
jgi:quinol monooxygenase YgiN